MSRLDVWRNLRIRSRMLVAVALLLGAVLSGVPAAPAPTSAQSSLSLVPVTGNLDSPVAMANAGDGTNRLFVVERPGRIRVIVDGQLQETPFLDLTDRVHTDDSEQGLLALAFHPDYETNGELFVLYTANDWANTVERFSVSANDPNRADPASGQILLATPDREPNHNGGSLVFGPDGMLYITTGDEGGGGDPYRNAQNLSSLFGKILRVDVDHGDPYAIPPDNPFVDTENARPEVWAYGLRNPWRISFDRETSDLWVADVGQSTWEEVNYVPAGTGAGRNFGWSQMEGQHCFAEDCDPSLYTLPIAEYSHDDGCSVTGGYVYRGSDYPALAGRYFFGDYCSGKIWSLTPDGDGWTMTPELDTDSWITSFGEDEAGELYLVDLAGVLYQVTTSDQQSPSIDDPAMLRTWQRTDKPVADLSVDRTWMWGPEPFTDTIPEPYAESPDGSRMVQYFDKARMEITQPDAEDDGIWYVTNGLLVVEMMSGQIQTGDNQFEPHQPSTENVAGDPGVVSGPTYATLAPLRDAPPAADGATLTQRIAPDGTVTDDPALASFGITAAQRVQVPHIDHQIASVFWEFMNSTATVYEDGVLVSDLLFVNPYYATGYPITEAYWTTILLDGNETDVLLQCFERRCLTYTPGNQPGWQVEAGNVGQHYYRWRYGS